MSLNSPLSALVGPVVRAVKTGNVLWVDAINGNNTTAKVDRADKPYLTLTAAQAAASSGDTISVRPGTYTDSALGKTGVNWYFMAGSKIEISGDLTADRILWTDNNTAMTFTVDGFGEFISTTSAGEFDSTGIKIAHNSTVITFRCKKLSVTGDTLFGNPRAYNVANGELYLTADRIEGSTTIGSQSGSALVYLNARLAVNSDVDNGSGFEVGGTSTLNVNLDALECAGTCFYTSGSVNIFGKVNRAFSSLSSVVTATQSELIDLQFISVAADSGYMFSLSGGADVRINAVNISCSNGLCENVGSLLSVNANRIEGGGACALSAGGTMRVRALYFYDSNQNPFINTIITNGRAFLNIDRYEGGSICAEMGQGKLVLTGNYTNFGTGVACITFNRSSGTQANSIVCLQGCVLYTDHTESIGVVNGSGNRDVRVTVSSSSNVAVNASVTTNITALSLLVDPQVE